MNDLITISIFAALILKHALHKLKMKFEIVMPYYLMQLAEILQKQSIAPSVIWYTISIAFSSVVLLKAYLDTSTIANPLKGIELKATQKNDLKSKRAGW